MRWCPLMNNELLHGTFNYRFPQMAHGWKTRWLTGACGPPVYLSPFSLLGLFLLVCHKVWSKCDFFLSLDTVNWRILLAPLHYCSPSTDDFLGCCFTEAWHMNGSDFLYILLKCCSNTISLLWTIHHAWGLQMANLFLSRILSTLIGWRSGSWFAQ